MRIRTIRGRIVLAIVLVGCIPLLIGLVLAYVSGMRSLRDVIGGNLQAVAVQAGVAGDGWYRRWLSLRCRRRASLPVWRRWSHPSCKRMPTG